VKLLPFPPQLAALSARAAAETYNLHRGHPPREHVTKGIACYRLPGGGLQMSQDLYRPQYPEGATPGLGVVQFRQNSSGPKPGYVVTVTGFTPVDELFPRARPSISPTVVKTGNAVMTGAGGADDPTPINPQNPFSSLTAKKCKSYGEACTLTDDMERRSKALFDMTF